MKRAKAPRRAQPFLTMPPELVSKIVAMRESPNGRGWLRLLELLREAACDPVVQASSGATGFLSVVTILAEDGLTDTNGGDTLLPLDGALPLGEVGAKFVGNSGRGEGPVKKLVRDVLPKLEKRLKRKAYAHELWSACAAKPKTGIKFVSDPTWGTPQSAIPASGAPTHWPRFRVIVSEVRRGLKQ